MKRIRIETDEKAPLDPELLTYINNLNHHLDFTNIPYGNNEYLLDIGKGSSKMNATLYGNFLVILHTLYLDKSDIYLIWALARGLLQGVRGAQPPAGAA